METKLQVLRAKARDLSIGAAAMLLTGIAMATPADPFDAAVATATTKVQGYGAALVGLAAVGVVFMIAIKYVKKIRGAS
jgi:hypothetical protein